MRWVIGDIHGMFRPLQALLELIHQIDQQPRFYFVGDYINRGPDSRQVLDLIISLPRSLFIRGNHDDILDQILHGTHYATNPTDGDRLAAFTWFMQHGLMATLLSYGADYAELEHLENHPNLARLESLLARLIPPAHAAFIRTLPPVIEEDDFFVAHGKWDVSDITEQPSLATQLADSVAKRERLLWGRFTDEEIRGLKGWRRTGYFGHTPVDNYPALLPSREFIPVIGPKIVLLDTAAALSANGRLTAVCHETQTYHQADRFGRVLTVEGVG